MATGRIWSESSSRWGWIMLKLSITSIIKFIRIRNHGHHANMVARQRSQMNQHDMPCILIGTLRPHSCGVCRCKGGQDAWDRMGWGRGKVVQPIIGRAIWPTYWCEVHAMSMCRYVYQKRLWQQRPTSLHSEIMDDRGTTSKGSLWCSICFRVPELSTWGFQLCEGLSEGQRDREHSTEFYKRFPVAKGSWRCWKVCSLHHPWNHHGITFFAEVKWCIFVWTFPLHKLSMVPAVEAATALRRQWGSLLLYHGYIRMQLAFFKLPCFFSSIHDAHAQEWNCWKRRSTDRKKRVQKRGRQTATVEVSFTEVNRMVLYEIYMKMSWNVWKHHEIWKVHGHLANFPTLGLNKKDDRMGGSS